MPEWSGELGVHMYSIKTAAGLREAVWDVICDECQDGITMQFLSKRLPYGARTRRVVKELIDSGALIRIGYGKYVRA